MSLREKIAAYKEQFLAKAPPEKVALMAKATRELEQSDILEGILKAGERAPEFALQDEGGALVRLEELRGRGPVVLSFYRGLW
jgi:AhpC/TSA family